MIIIYFLINILFSFDFFLKLIISLFSNQKFISKIYIMRFVIISKYTKLYKLLFTKYSYLNKSIIIFFAFFIFFIYIYNYIDYNK